MTGGGNGSGHDGCGAKTRSGSLCALPAGWGTVHPGVGRCKLHGGSTPNHNAHAERVLTDRAEASALAELHSRGVPPLGNPLVVLAQLAAEAREWQVIMRGQVSALESVSQMTPAGIEQVRTVVILFERAMDRAAALAVMCARLNIDSRLARISEEQAQVVFDVTDRSLRQISLTEEQWRAAREVFAREWQQWAEDRRRASGD
jgi:hypothetical protein